MLEYPQVALDFMNRDHAEFVALSEKLLTLLTQKDTDAEVDALLERLLEHTRHHFAEEEWQMQEAHFPPYRMHKGEHDRVLAELASRAGNWHKTRDAAGLRAVMESVLNDWFVNHVNTMDFVTASFIAQAKT